MTYYKRNGAKKLRKKGKAKKLPFSASAMAMYDKKKGR